MTLPCLHHNSPNLCAIVLAGGQSSRMGQDKASIAIDGVTLLQRTCEVALSCSDRVYVVAAWPQRYQHLPLASACEFLTEADPQGPLIGFYNGLSRIDIAVPSCDWVLLLACDLPNLEAIALQSWATKLPDLTGTVMAYLPKHAALGANQPNKQSKHWEPLCGFYRRNCSSDLQAFIANGGKSFQRWLTQIQVAEVPDVMPQMLFNCNTPAELSML
jgi:molybdopterin-guanine dinucleotide biosynthesis protein A